MTARLLSLRRQVEATEIRLRLLKVQLAEAEQQDAAARHIEQAYQGGVPAEWISEALGALQQDTSHDIAQWIRQGNAQPGALYPQQHAHQQPVQPQPRRWPLEGEEYQRYGRQMILSEIGLHGQLRLKGARVLVVGLGGLGCPAAVYLAGAGIGTLGLMDGDHVEVSNLHRQIIHSTDRVGMSKVDSAHEHLKSLNYHVKYVCHRFSLTVESALPLFEQYDLILDCTDHPTSRYLISDACVLTGRPLVSASALKTEGQLMVLNNPPRVPGDVSGGPCYRCVFPKPPPAESVISCGEGGVLGPVVGVMGVLQALEAIKIITEKPHAANTLQLGALDEPLKPSLLLFSAYSSPQFRNVRLRSRRGDCATCSAHATITRQNLEEGLIDYVAFCGVANAINVLPPEARISASEFAKLPRDGSNLLIDTRDETQYAMCALKGSINVPWTGSAESWLTRAIHNGALSASGEDHYIICRLGNDSQIATKAIQDFAPMRIRVRDIMGGFDSWRKEVDQTWPDY